MAYTTRRSQFQVFVKAFYRDADLRLTRRQRALLSKMVRGIAVCAAAEERTRTVQILERRPMNPTADICSRSVLEILGYEKT